MRRFALLLPAIASLLAVVSLQAVPTRPRYGGVLRMEMRAVSAGLDPASKSAGSESTAARNTLAALVYETLVRFDEQGRAEPCLATSWQSEARQDRWLFVLRQNVRFHDGTPLTPALAAGALAAAMPDRRVKVSGNGIAVEADQPMPDLLWELAEPANAVTYRAPAGTVYGTGPFRIAEWQASHARLSANQEYWAGRPFLDGINLEMGRNARDQLLDLDLDRADLVELAPQEVRRSSSGPPIQWSSASMELMALVFNRLSPVQAEVRKALALSIDRAAIHAVLVQKHGDIATSLLPGWLSGYAFLFSAGPEDSIVNRTPVSLVLTYDSSDPLAKATADRIAVDARKAGITIRPLAAASTKFDSDVRLARVRITVSSPARSLSGLVAALGLSDAITHSSLQSVDGAYAVERTLLEDHAVIPLLHLPEMYAVGSRVRTWNTPAVTKSGSLRLDDVWLAADKL